MVNAFAVLYTSMPFLLDETSLPSPIVLLLA